MKKIAITQRLVLNDEYYEVREALDIKWGLLMSELDLLPIALSIECDFKLYFELLDIDGIILTGGNDLNSLNPNRESNKRDIFEKKLIAYGINNNIPIFGVCRGMQIIAEYFQADFSEVKNQINIKHTLNVNAKSRYFQELDEISRVNAYHNYSVHNLPKDFLISATNSDGMIKAIEHRKYKIFAQMWHTEREEPFDECELNLVRKFFND